MLTREIPAVTKNLLIINSIMFIATWVTENMGIDLTGLLGLHFFLAPDFHLYQIFTYMFMHGGLGHIFMNMFMLWMFGPVMEAYWGSRKFFFYYIICGLGAGFCQELAQFGQFYIICNEQVPGFTFADTMMVVRANQGLLNLWTTVGASGALYGILLAYGMYFPNERMFVIPFPFPLKVRWVIAGSIVLELFSAIATTNDGVAHLAHLGGMLFGYILTILQVPQALMRLVTEGDLNRWIVMLGINIMLLILGCVLETVSIILIILPMLYPIIKALGFDPIWFNVVLLINMELALITPPVGMNLFVIKGISEDSSIQDIIAGAAPFAAIMVFEILLLCFVPEIATWLPSVLK